MNLCPVPTFVGNWKSGRQSLSLFFALLEQLDLELLEVREELFVLVRFPRLRELSFEVQQFWRVAERCVLRARHRWRLLPRLLLWAQRFPSLQIGEGPIGPRLPRGLYQLRLPQFVGQAL